MSDDFQKLFGASIGDVGGVNEKTKKEDNPVLMEYAEMTPDSAWLEYAIEYANADVGLDQHLRAAVEAQLLTEEEMNNILCRMLGRMVGDPDDTGDDVDRDKDDIGTTEATDKPDNETAARQAADDLEKCSNCGKQYEDCQCDEMPKIRDENDEVEEKVEQANANPEGDEDMSEHSEIVREVMGAHEDMPMPTEEEHEDTRAAKEDSREDKPSEKSLEDLGKWVRENYPPTDDLSDLGVGDDIEDEDGNLWRVSEDDDGEKQWELRSKASDSNKKADGQEKQSEEQSESNRQEKEEESGTDKEEEDQVSEDPESEDDKPLGQINYEAIVSNGSCHWNKLHQDTKAIYTRGAAQVARVVKERELRIRKSPGKIFYDACAAETMRNNPSHVCPPYEAMSNDEQLACEAGAIAVQMKAVGNLSLNITGSIKEGG